MAQHAPPLLPSGSRLGGYEVRALVGRGGMGEVYRAKQISMQREVALKILSPRLARQDPAFADQFVAEARAAGQLNHPNIVAVHDVGQAPAPEGCAGVEPGTAIHYFSMEFIEGETVKDVIERQGAVDIPTVGRVMAAMAEALAFAEQHKIVHRDIKPDNIMLASGGGVKLADLGLALQADSAEAVAGSKDEQGRGKVMGTPLYMAPEQARAQPIDHRADQYALGATLFHMLTGSPPYQGESSKAIMRAHCFEPVPDPAEVNPQVPPPWRELCLRMMAKQPADRFAGAAELRAACKAAIRWRPGPAPRTARQRRAGSRLPLVIAAIAAAAAAWWWFGRPAAPPPARPAPSQQAAPPAGGPQAPAQDPAREAAARAEKALAALPDDPYAALAVVERLLADPSLQPAKPLLEPRREALQRAIEERRRTQLTATLDAALQDAAAGRLNAARTGLGSVPDEPWARARRSEVAARIELSERTIENRISDAVPQAGDARALDVLADEVRRSELSAARGKAIAERIEARRRELAQAAKPPPKMQKPDAAQQWRALAEAVEAARATMPYSALSDAARAAARALPDGDRQHAERLADIGEAAANAETALRLHIGQARPRVDCRIGSRSGTYLLTRLERDRVGVRLVDAPAETMVDRATVTLPWAQLLDAALSGPDKERSKAAFLWFWRHEDARRALQALRDDPLAAAVAAYERRTRPLAIAGDQERRRDGTIAVSYAFPGGDPELLSAWKGDGAALEAGGLRWATDRLVPRGSSAEADLAALRWQSALRPPFELEARVVPDPDSEVVMLGIAAGDAPVLRVAFNAKLRRAFLIASRPDDPASYQAHGANGAPEYAADGANVRIAVDAEGRFSAWVDGRPVPGDRDLSVPADARLVPLLQGRPVQARSGLTVQRLTVSGRP